MKYRVLLFFVSFCWTQILFSQQRSDANIVGHVVSAGEHLPYATVSIMGTTMGVRTDETGHFLIIDLKPGTYVFSPMRKWDIPITRMQ